MSIPTPWEAAGKPEYHYGTQRVLEETFLTQIAASSPRVALTQVGQTVEGWPLRVVRIGAPEAPAFAAHPESMLFVGGQHGNEGSPPEALFKLIRELAATTDQTLVDYLTARPVFIIPNLNRDGTERSEQRNANDVNLNRDHLALTQPETQALWKTIGVVQPNMVYDMHTGGLLDVDVEPSQYPGVDPGILELGETAAEGIRDYLRSQGSSTGPLPVNLWNPTTLRSTGGIAGTLAFLSETYGGPVMTYRHVHDYRSAMGALLWHGQNTARIAATLHVAKLRAIRVGREAEAPYLIGEAHAHDSVTISPPPRSYTISAQRWDALELHREAFGIQGVNNGDGTVTIDMGQPARAIIPFVLDPDSTEATARARRQGRPPHGPPIAWGPIRIAGKDLPVTSVDYITQGQPHRIWP